MLDLRLRGGIVVDGTGAPGRREDVAVRGGRIVVDDGSDARRTIDAEGLVVAPGFVDLHTHYDAQVFWDPMLTPSPLHGVTTVVAGNCGFALAPMSEEHQDYIARMLARVEGMPYDAIADGVPWGWCRHGELFTALEARGVGVNIGVMAGHSTVRRFVMGERASAERATAEEVQLMAREVERAVSEGALGFTTSQALTQPDGDGRPVPSRFADDDEILALAGTVRGHRGTMVQYAPPSDRFEDETVELMLTMSLAADRPVNWNLLIVSDYDAEHCEHQLAATARGRERGATIRGLMRPDPVVFRLSLVNAIQRTTFKNWHELKLPLAERITAFTDAENRTSLRARAEDSVLGHPAVTHELRWGDYVIGETISTANAGLSGRTVGDVARDRGIDPFDAFLDIAIADEFRGGFYPYSTDGGDEGWAARARLCADPRMIVGGSDAGGHLDMMCGPVYSSFFVGEYSRRGLLSLEECVRLVTTVPAEYIGLVDRGRIAEGYAADLVVFDPSTIGPGPVDFRYDLPAGGGRVYAPGSGIHRVIVNGEDIVAEGNLTDARPGAVLRSGQDTQTFDNAAGLAALARPKVSLPG